MKFCKTCNRKAESEEFNFCPNCGYELIDKMILQIPFFDNFFSEEWLKRNLDLTKEQVRSLTFLVRSSAVEIEFDGDNARTVEIVAI